MKLKTLLTAGIAMLGLTAGAAMAEQIKVGIAAEPYPPFMSLDASGTWVGWEIDIANAICAAEKMDCVITPVAWDGIIPSLTAKQIDAIVASMTITEDRLKTIDFSDKYYNTPSVVIAAKTSEVTATPEGLAGKILGVQASTIHQTYAQKYFTGASTRSRPTASQWLISLHPRAAPVARSRVQLPTIRLFWALAWVWVSARVTMRCASSSMPGSRPFVRTAPMTRSPRNTSPWISTAAKRASWNI